MPNYKIETFKDSDFSMDVRIDVENKTILMNKDELATMFNRSLKSITRHLTIIKSQYGTNVSPVDDKMSLVAQKMSLVQLEGDREVEREIDCYNLEIIMLIGERIKSNRGILLKEFLDNYLYGDTSNIIIYNNGNLKLDVKVSPEEETVWLNQSQIAQLFDVTQQTISRHILNILSEGELDISVHKEYLYTALDGKTYFVDFYNLDMILAIGYRVSGTRAIEFRKWASSVLKQYLLKGYVLDDERITLSKENFIKLENDVSEIKNEIEDIKEKTFIKPVKARLFFDGAYYDAYEFISNLVNAADEEVLLIDPYFDSKGLNVLKKAKENIKILLCVSKKARLIHYDINVFKKQYNQITIRYNDSIHDRFLILDNKECYSLGTSLNYMGKRVFAINKIEDKDIIVAIKNKATSN